MFLEFFGLSDDPFRITPNPQFAYCGAQFSALRQTLGENLAHGPGLALLYGKSGVGKTLLLRMLQDDLSSDAVACRVIACSCNSGLTARDSIELADPELAQRLEQEERLDPTGQCLTVLMLDEAQHMETAELVRLVRIAKSGRIHIVLAGSPELAERIAAMAGQKLIPALHSYRLEPLPAPEIARFIDVRLEAAGGAAGKVFSPEALARAAVYAGGLPSQINRLCAAAMLAALLDESRYVAVEHIDSGAAECGLSAPESSAVTLVPEPLPPVLRPKAGTRAPSSRKSLRVAAAALAVCALLFVANNFYDGDFGSVPGSQMFFAVLREPPVKPVAMASYPAGITATPKPALITDGTIEKLRATVTFLAGLTAGVVDDLIVASLTKVPKTDFSVLTEANPKSMGSVESVADPLDLTADVAPPFTPITAAFAVIDEQHVARADTVLPLPETLVLDADPEMATSGTGLNSVRVFIHHTAGGDADAATAHRLARYLTENGIIVADIRAVKFRIGAGSVRYFFQINAEAGAMLMEHLDHFFQGDPATGPARLVDFTYYEPKPGWGALEVWIPTS